MILLLLLIAAILPAEPAPPRFDYAESQDFTCWVCGDDGIYFQRFTFCQLLCRNYKDHLGEHVIDHWVMQGNSLERMKPDPTFNHDRGVWQYVHEGRVIEARGYYRTAADFDIEVQERSLWPQAKRLGLRCK